MSLIPTSTNPVGCTNPPGYQIVPDIYPAGAPIYRSNRTGWCYPYGGTSGSLALNAQYGYEPRLGPAIVFLVCFSLLLIAHFALTIKSRRWWLFVGFLGSLSEAIGWAARTASGVKNDWSEAARSWFICQIILITLAPVFYSAQCYGCYIYLVALRPSATTWSPKKLTIAWVTIDVSSLVLQAIGGGIASTAKPGRPNARDRADLGSRIMLSGIIVQLASMIYFAAVFARFYWRSRRHEVEIPVAKGTRPGALAAGTAIAAFFIIWRGAYRTSELSEGWRGALIKNEIYFYVFDALLMVFAGLALAVFHPAIVLPRDRSIAGPGLLDSRPAARPPLSPSDSVEKDIA